MRKVRCFVNYEEVYILDYLIGLICANLKEKNREREITTMNRCFLTHLEKILAMDLSDSKDKIDFSQSDSKERLKRAPQFSIDFLG